MRTDGSGTFWGCLKIEVVTIKNVVLSTKEDAEAETKTYCVSIEFSRLLIKKGLFVFAWWTEGTAQFEFVIDEYGIVKFDNSNKTNRENAYWLFTDEISEALAQEILRVASENVPGALSGRTVKGIAREIRWHCPPGLIGIGPTIIADIGGMDKSKDSYDYNAKVFENPWRPSNWIEVLCEYLS